MNFIEWSYSELSKFVNTSEFIPQLLHAEFDSLEHITFDAKGFFIAETCGPLFSCKFKLKASSK